MIVFFGSGCVGKCRDFSFWDVGEACSYRVATLNLSLDQEWNSATFGENLGIEEFPKFLGKLHIFR